MNPDISFRFDNKFNVYILLGYTNEGKTFQKHYGNGVISKLGKSITKQSFEYVYNHALSLQLVIESI